MPAKEKTSSSTKKRFTKSTTSKPKVIVKYVEVVPKPQLEEVHQDVIVKPSEEVVKTKVPEQIPTTPPSPELPVIAQPETLIPSQPQSGETSHDPLPNAPTSQQEGPKDIGTNPIWDEPEKKSSKVWLFVIIGIVIISLGGVSGFFLWKQTSMAPAVTKKPVQKTEQVTVTQVPTPAIFPTVSLTKYTIKVLNGSGTAGVAAKAKTLLTNAGFTVSGIDNADTSNFTKTIISIKATVDATYVQKLQDALSTNYLVSSVTTPLANSADSDVVVIIGSSTSK